MAKILLLDFTEDDLKRFLDKKADAECKETNWKSGHMEILTPPPDCRLIFYQVNGLPIVPSVHSGDTEYFDVFVQTGGAVICFLGEAREYHLTNILGPIPGLKFGGIEDLSQVTPVDGSSFQPVFSKFSPDIKFAKSIAVLPPGMPQTADPNAAEVLQPLAQTPDKKAVAGIFRKGRGFILLLPWFGEKNIDVADYLFQDILPKTSPELFGDETFPWMESYEFYFPSLKDIFKQIETETERYRHQIRTLRAKIEGIKRQEQEPFNKLLKGGNEDLKSAVKTALDYLEWKTVVDVDSYWKRVIRHKEEDFWLLEEADNGSLEVNLRKNSIILLVLRNGLAAAPDADCDVLQKFKGRRMQEFENTKMKTVLIGNYYFKEDARSRPNPFSQAQIDEAIGDKNGLLTAYELFKAIKAEKEGKITKEAIRRQLKEKVGLITFEY